MGGHGGSRGGGGLNPQQAIASGISKSLGGKISTKANLQKQGFSFKGRNFIVQSTVSEGRPIIGIIGGRTSGRGGIFHQNFDLTNPKSLKNMATSIKSFVKGK
jgi:hypothetical protein